MSAKAQFDTYNARIPRYSFTSSTPSARGVHGGWWPSSSNPISEFSGLIVEVRSRFGDVIQVDYDRQLWGTAPRRVVVADHPVRFDGFDEIFAGHIILFTSDGRRFRLVVVPPATPFATAQRLLAQAADPPVAAAVLRSPGLFAA